MSGILKPVTPNHVRQAGRQRKAEFAGVFSEATIERSSGESVALLGGPSSTSSSSSSPTASHTNA
jgi:hypothetical protein